MQNKTDINVDIARLPVDLVTGIKELQADFAFSFHGETVLTAKNGAAGICKTQNGFEITYTKKSEFYREFVKLLRGEKDIREECVFNSLGVMFDCSRNAVLKVSAVKKYVRLLACMGYDTLMLYTEDTYEIESEPYFGYLRGRYTKAEIREIVDYARVFGIEVVPCIQTLAHMNAITRWERFKPIIDFNDILLIDEEKTYELIDKMFRTLTECFTSRKVHIGMDEAHMVGLGKYLDEHGYQNRFDVLFKHLKRVLGIADKYGFACTMWSDMFFRLACKGLYEPTDFEMPESVKDVVPKNLTLMYWDYYHNGKADYERMIKAHKQLTDRISFAGGAWRWRGFAPNNTMSVNRTGLALDACKESGIKDVIMTVWGDDGCECSAYSVLPTLVCAAERAYGNTDYKKAFERTFGIRYEDFNALELADDVLQVKNKFYGSNISRIFLYNDALCGIYDYVVKPEYKKRLKENVLKLMSVADRTGEFKYIFETMIALTELNVRKCDLGVRLRTAYKAKDTAALKVTADEIPIIINLIDKFYDKFKLQWDKENKPFGFEVQDLRLGGLKQRLAHCREILIAYAEGRTTEIPELEQEILPAYPFDESGDFRCNHLWRELITVNTI